MLLFFKFSLTTSGNAQGLLIALCLGITSLCLGNHMGCWGLNLGSHLLGKSPPYCSFSPLCLMLLLKTFKLLCFLPSSLSKYPRLLKLSPKPLFKKYFLYFQLLATTLLPSILQPIYFLNQSSFLLLLMTPHKCMSSAPLRGMAEVSSTF